MALPLLARLPRGRSLLAWIAATIMVLAIGGFLLASSGLYNIAASVPHIPVTRWFLHYAMQRSVSTQSLIEQYLAGQPAWRRALEVEGADRLGAAHFQGGCAFCHGAPGEPPVPVTQGMRPAPPALSEALPGWDDEELFWIVRHGFKYTGMPAWPAVERQDEVWSLVAFLRRLPGLDAEGYRTLAYGNSPPASEPAAEILEEGVPPGLASCARCHDDGLAPAVSRLVPRLAGLSRDYLATALTHYAEGRRPSGIMEPVAVALDPGEIAALADHYAGLPRAPAADAVPADPESLALGERIATRGLPEALVPACLACHGETRLAIFPSLDGQPAPYLAGQLRLWREGVRGETPQDRLMAPIAKRLTEAEVEAVATYFETRAGGAPAEGQRP
ncbi:MAG: c-type cytochrome [Tistlia sp.]|uniref:c-type cytochrome n=1 Tax=Tistlia sp. TaxID=3057121 RepID=UPI0034A50DE6